ncbi:hypothetical protein [Cohnella silvisoli]|uniref:DUF2508 family protein n=1 Tax=Cohnella silvisoli TaxID=2873699 RepID=A0ABV1KWB4_9BACL|nr:hypothetical protein [Cohnella silvisoli]MCD9023485.1 hypothetical protein [Cohnella silvisoli]
MKPSYFQHLDDQFDKVLNKAMRRLHKNEKYMTLMRQRMEIQEQHPFVLSLIEEHESIFPNDEEYRAWLEIKRTLRKMEKMERLAIYRQGHADSYDYFNRSRPSR